MNIHLFGSYLEQNLTNVYKHIHMYIHIDIVSVSQNTGQCELIENRDVKILKMNLTGFVPHPKWS